MSVLPRVSILTPTKNRRQFLSMSINNLLTTNYPKELLEWVILDDGTERFIPDEGVLNNIKKIVAPIRVKYVYCDDNRFTTLGSKRNALVVLASSPYLVNMDDDDIHASNHIKNGIEFLLKHKRKTGLVGHNSFLCLFPYKEFKITYNRCSETDLLTITENSMIFTKKHWKLSGGFADITKGEGIRLLFGYTKACHLYSEKNTTVINLFHKKNLLDLSPLAENAIVDVTLSAKTIGLVEFITGENAPSLLLCKDDLGRVMQYGTQKEVVERNKVQITPQ